jgi:hypothetical protein
VLLLIGCGKKMAPVSIEKWVKYEDVFFQVNFEYPDGWHKEASTTSANVYTSSEHVGFFADPQPKAPEGVQFSITYSKLEVLRTAKVLADTEAAEMKTSGYFVDPMVTVIVDSLEAYQFGFHGAFSEEAKIYGSKTYIVRDSMLYLITFKAFNKYYEAYKGVFDNFLVRVKFPKPKIKAKVVDPELPSEELTPFENEFVKLAYPANFDIKFPESKGEVKFSMQITAYRQDCNFSMDMRPAKNLTVEKVFEQNSKNFKATNKGESKIDEQKAIWIDYTPMSQIKSRVYFVVKSDKFYRLFINYYSPKKDKYLPAFEKIVGSVKLK